ncbi:hypothetical protein PG985_008264 [Apiospora marii]|uniref:uncharacterized protein n=1 Tax=Apiospora marii TaxID=335849 RepID=UPI00312FEC57
MINSASSFFMRYRHCGVRRTASLIARSSSVRQRHRDALQISAAYWRICRCRSFTFKTRTRLLPASDTGLTRTVADARWRCRLTTCRLRPLSRFRDPRPRSARWLHIVALLSMRCALDAARTGRLRASHRCHAALLSPLAVGFDSALRYHAAAVGDDDDA